MLINTPISLGELLDKISILIIKKKNIKDKDKLKLITNELKLLNKTLDNVLSNDLDIKIYLNKLIFINTKLWKIEDNIRECERLKKYDEEFINLARSIYFTNDKRSKIKLEVNNKFGSTIIEVKSYEVY